eukprot:523418-Amphidinium_carterae.1
MVWVLEHRRQTGVIPMANMCFLRQLNQFEVYYLCCLVTYVSAVLGVLLQAYCGTRNMQLTSYRFSSSLVGI